MPRVVNLCEKKDGTVAEMEQELTDALRCECMPRNQPDEPERVITVNDMVSKALVAASEQQARWLNSLLTVCNELSPGVIPTIDDMMRSHLPTCTFSFDYQVIFRCAASMMMFVQRSRLANEFLELLLAAKPSQSQEWLHQQLEKQAATKLSQRPSSTQVAVNTDALYRYALLCGRKDVSKASSLIARAAECGHIGARTLVRCLLFRS